MTAAAFSRNGAAHGGRDEAASILAGAWPSDGRHGAAMHLAGGLLRAGWSVEDVEQFISGVCEAAGDEHLERRLGDVRSTARKLVGGKPVSGWPKLAEVLGDDVVRRVRAALGLVLTVESLARAKGLPADFLRSLGVHDLEDGDGVGIEYRDLDGDILAVKRRTSPVARLGSFWPEGRPVMPYGLDRLGAAREAGRVVLVEGESDCWALWYAGYPALGLPGATAAKALDAEHVRGIGAVYVVREPDDAGGRFVHDLAGRLALFGMGLRVLVVTMPDGLKDPAELFKDDPARFAERMQAALDDAGPAPVAACAAEEPLAPAEPPWPDPPDAQAFHGLAGEFVRVIEPASEASPIALLVQLLVGFGNVLGRTAFFRAEADRHYCNEFAVLVGRSSKGRKGSSWGHVHRALTAAEEQWAADRIQSGLSSGEGLIWAVRDPINKRERVKERGEPARYEEVEADPGVSDKRLLVYEPEFANVLKQTERQGNTLSAILRQAWDGVDLRTLTKNSPARATGAHISLLGHVTSEELRRYLTLTETANGFGNRHLWVAVDRAKCLPEGGAVDEDALADLCSRLGKALAFGRGRGVMRRDEEAREVWADVYEELSEGRPGLSGALLGRAEAHVMRLALLYAVLDLAEEIGAEHLLAALALWDYCERSVRHVFGDSVGDPVADDILRLLRSAPNGMTRSEIYKHFGCNLPSARIGQALATLGRARLVSCTTESTGGRPADRWRASGRPQAGGRA